MLSFFPGSTRSPQFMNDEMQNHTVRVGSEATFSCTVEHLNTYKVAWLHSEKGTLAVYPTVISHNNRISVRHDNRHAYYLHLRDIQESDAGKYICQLNTDPAISVRGSLNVVGKKIFFISTYMFCDMIMIVGMLNFYRSTEVAGEGGPDLAPQKFLSSQKFRHLMG